MSDEVLKVEKLENGFAVVVRDPKVDAANRKPKANWESPWKEYAFSTSKEVIAFVTSHLGSLPKSAGDEFNDAAEEAFSKE